MRFYHLSIISVVALLGCSNSVQPTTTPANNTVNEAPTSHVQAKPKTEPSLSDKAEAGGRFVWNEAKSVWEWLTSEEVSKRAGEVYQTVKSAVKNAYDAAVKEYEDPKKDDKKLVEDQDSK